MHSDDGAKEEKSDFADASQRSVGYINSRLVPSDYY